MRSRRQSRCESGTEKYGLDIEVIHADTQSKPEIGQIAAENLFIGRDLMHRRRRVDADMQLATGAVLAIMTRQIVPTKVDGVTLIWHKMRLAIDDTLIADPFGEYSSGRRFLMTEDGFFRSPWPG